MIDYASKVYNPVWDLRVLTLLERALKPASYLYRLPFQQSIFAVKEKPNLPLTMHDSLPSSKNVTSLFPNDKAPAADESGQSANEHCENVTPFTRDVKQAGGKADNVANFYVKPNDELAMQERIRASLILDGAQAPLDPELAGWASAFTFERAEKEAEKEKILFGLPNSPALTSLPEFVNLYESHTTFDYDHLMYDDPLQFLRKLHETILGGEYPKEVTGRYRTVETVVNDGFSGKQLYKPADPKLIPKRLEELATWMREKSWQQPAFLASAIIHWQLLDIQPFLIANGRVARMFVHHFLGNWDPLTAHFAPESWWAAHPFDYAKETALVAKRGGDINGFAKLHLWAYAQPYSYLDVTPMPDNTRIFATIPHVKLRPKGELSIPCLPPDLSMLPDHPLDLQPSQSALDLGFRNLRVVSIKELAKRNNVTIPEMSRRLENQRCFSVVDDPSGLYWRPIRTAQGSVGFAPSLTGKREY